MGKDEFPRFGGENPRGWVMQCETYFMSYPEETDSGKIALACLHMDGKAMNWYVDRVEDMKNISWVDFVAMVIKRFTIPAEDDDFFQERKKIDEMHRRVKQGLCELAIMGAICIGFWIYTMYYIMCE